MSDFLRLINFRNYTDVTLEFAESDIFVIYGQNGQGKTNVLEALSIFADGRGLRRASSVDIAKRDSNFWSVMLELDGVSFFCGYENDKRIYKVDDKKVQNLSTFSKKYYVLWMTYETDRLFVEAPSKRRAFIDMFCCARFADHESIVREYEKLARERLKIIKQNWENINEKVNSWLCIIEKQLAKLGTDIANRRAYIAKEIAKDQDIDDVFPKFESKMSNIFTNFNGYEEELASRRAKDFYTNSTTFGPNKADWIMDYTAKCMNASYCSAGEQKMLLLGAFINFVKNNIKNDKRSLILLLDDVIAHLDDAHKSILFDHIIKIVEYFKKNEMIIKVILTGTDVNLFTRLENATKYHVYDSCITKC